MNKIKNFFTRIFNFLGVTFEWFEEENITQKRKPKMDKIIKKDKKKIDKMMNELIKKDIPRDKEIEKCKKVIKKRPTQKRLKSKS